MTVGSISAHPSGGTRAAFLVGILGIPRLNRRMLRYGLQTSQKALFVTSTSAAIASLSRTHVPIAKLNNSFVNFNQHHYYSTAGTPHDKNNDTTTTSTFFQDLRKSASLSSTFEKLFIRSKIITDQDLARITSKTLAGATYATAGITALGTIGVDTSPLVAGIGITGFTIGFALKEIATNALSGFLLVLSRPFKTGMHIKVLGMEGTVEAIDVRYVKLRVKSDNSLILIPSALVYSNSIIVQESNANKKIGNI